MAEAARKLEHPYVTKIPGICGGEPVVRATRTPVRVVVQYALRERFSPEELVHEFPNLTLASIYDALSYYYDHQDEIQALTEQNQEKQWKAE